MTGQQLSYQIDTKLYKSSRFAKERQLRVRAAQVTVRPQQEHLRGDELLFHMGTMRNMDGCGIVKGPLDYIVGGVMVEKTQSAMDVAREEMVKSREELQQTQNEMTKLVDHLLSLTAKHIKEIREARMVVTHETAQLMGSLREVRKFFLEDTHDTEMHRLQAFAGTCAQLKRLADDGTLDTIITAILKLGVKA